MGGGGRSSDATAVVSFTSPYGNQQRSARNVPSLDKVLVPEADAGGRQLGWDGNLPSLYPGLEAWV